MTTNPKSQPIKILPLQWEENEGNYPGQQVWSFDDNQTMWIVKNPNDEKYVLCEIVTIEFAPVSPVIGTFDNIEEAKDAGQKHHEKRILSFIDQR